MLDPRPRSTPAILARQAGAFLIVWIGVFAVTATLDLLFNTVFRLVLVSWLCIGIGVMLSKRVSFPVPNGDRLDVRGAFATLWWAAFWPRYVGGGKGH